MSAGRIETPIGRTDVLEVTGKLTYRSEADLRDGFAALAWLHGWNVATEVTTSTGGRADVVLTAPSGLVMPIELKIGITTQRQARLGFQQADGYQRHFASDPTVVCVAFLAAVDIDRDVARPVDALYPKVNLVDYVSLLAIIRGDALRNLTDRAARAHVATARARQAAEIAALAESERNKAAAILREEHLLALSHNYPAAAIMLWDTLRVAA